MGGGGAVGGVLSGVLWDGLGAARVFELAALTALLGAAVWAWLSRYASAPASVATE
jgi:phosphate/sulfate permease